MLVHKWVKLVNFYLILHTVTFVHQDASVFASTLDDGISVTHWPAQGRHGWVQVVNGRIRLNGLILKEGDGADISHEARLEITAEGLAEILVFDLA